MLKQTGPSFIRLGKVPDKEFHTNKNNYALGDGSIIKDGSDIVIICIGNIVEDVVKAANKLDHSGINVKIVTLLTIKPINKKYII